MGTNLKIAGIVLAMIMLIVGFFVVKYQITRWWNYSWGYESKVSGSICELVEYEHLSAKGKEVCKGNEK